MSPQRRSITLGVELGSFDDPAAAVERAVEAERLGYDQVIVSNQDGSSDAWTLLSWIAGRTERIGLVASGLQSHHPTVLARATASLDLLSSGRVTLALDDPKWLPLLRSLWDTSTRKVHHEGELRVAGAEPGPLPAHDIRIWLRGDEEAAGREADGWIGQLDQHLSERLELLAQVTEMAGRDWNELDRVVTVADRWAELKSLVHEDGATAFVLRVDETTSADSLARFARDVGPELDRIGDGVISPVRVRRADVRARRFPGIDYNGLPAGLATTAVEPGDLRYNAARATYLRGGRPGLVLRPQTVSDVVDAVAFAQRHRHVPLGIRSGGHGISGRSTNDGGLVIDLGALNDIEVLDEDRRLVRIGPGTRWREVARALQPHGWALGSGDYGGVGVGGLATAGGVGFLGRKHGLTIDHLHAVEMVLADGSVVRAGHTENQELFWAVRGAGANFGIVTSFEFVVDEVPDVGWAQLAFLVEDPAEFLVKFGQAVAATPRETTPFLITNGSTAQVMAMVASDDPDVVISQLQPLARIAPLVQQQVVIAPYAAVMNMFPDAPHQGRGEPISRSGLVTEITPEFAQESARLLASGAAPWYQIRSMGGAISDVEPDETAFAHRDASFQLTVMGSNAQRVDHWWDRLRPHFSGIYLSFETDTSPERVAEAFPPETLARLRKLKAHFDPTNLFRDNFPLAGTETSGRTA